MSKLNPQILETIINKTKMSEQAVRNAVSKFKNSKCPKATQNAAAQLFAQSRGFSVAKKLKEEDRATLPSNIEFEKPLRIKKVNERSKSKKIMELIKFESGDYFINEHIKEINRAYTFGCYTSSFILCRKVFENLLIEIIRKKYPGKSQQERELYWDFKKNRFLDFSIILNNLDKKATDFGPESKLVKRTVQKASQFKDDANDKTHSLYHIVKNKKELEDKQPQEVIELIKKLNSLI
ncbi:MAG: hypothetical protein Q7R52_01545 [archaeon]|nr:hypothetical protein [archaeon]